MIENLIRILGVVSKKSHEMTDPNKSLCYLVRELNKLFEMKKTK